MKDRIPKYPGRVLVTPEDGSEAFYATLTRADEAEQDGDPINKNTLLKDATAALYELGSSAVPDEVLAKIYERLTNFNAQNIKSGILPVIRGGTGKANYAANQLLYALSATELGQLAFPNSAGAILRQDASGAPYWATPKETIESMGGGRVITGSYVGTNLKYDSDGSDQPVRIELGAVPKIVWLIRGDIESLPDAYSENAYNPTFACFINPVTKIKNYGSTTGVSGTTHNLTVTWDSTGVEFHINAVPDIAVGTVPFWSKIAYNSSGVTYHYIALV